MDIQGRTSLRKLPSPLALAPLWAGLFSIGLGLSAQAAPTAGTDYSQVEVDRIESSKIYFKNAPGIEPPPPIETGLSQIQVISHLRVSGASEEDSTRLSGIGPQLNLTAAPWLLLLAQPCRSCIGDERDLFLVRPSTGEIHEINHPGRIIDPKSGALVHESRAFYGRCVDGRKEGVFVFQREKVDRKNRLASSFYAAEATSHVLRETLLEKGFPSLKRTLARVKAGDCKEISGRSRRISGKVFDIKASRLALAEGIESNPDEETEDENDPNLRRATVGSEAGADSNGDDTGAPEAENLDDADGTSRTVKSPPSSRMESGTGARVASPEATAQELKSRITSPLGNGNVPKRGAVAEQKKL